MNSNIYSQSHVKDGRKHLHTAHQNILKNIVSPYQLHITLEVVIIVEHACALSPFSLFIL